MPTACEEMFLRVSEWSVEAALQFEAAFLSGHWLRAAWKLPWKMKSPQPGRRLRAFDFDDGDQLRRWSFESSRSISR
jgi:hypothetical protein